LRLARTETPQPAIADAVGAARLLKWGSYDQTIHHPTDMDPSVGTPAPRPRACSGIFLRRGAGATTGNSSCYSADSHGTHDQKAPLSVKSFHQQINLPMRVGIVIDASTSIRSRFQFEQQSAIEFLLEILKAKSDRAFVMGFDVTPSVTQDWTNDVDKLETGVNRLRPGGGTALFDAVYTACRDKLLDVSRGQEPVRKAIVLLSDGDDNQSRVRPDEVIKECERAETIIYAISTNWTPSRGKGDKVLQDMAEATGGQVFFPPTVDEMSVSFKQIEEELRSQYSLIYTPADFKYDGSFRSIYLYCNDRRYIVRAKKGYFAVK